MLLGAIRAVGSLIAGDELYTECVLENNVLEYIERLLDHKSSIIVQVCFGLHMSSILSTRAQADTKYVEASLGSTMVRNNIYTNFNKSFNSRNPSGYCPTSLPIMPII